MLYEIMKEVKNYFLGSASRGRFDICGGFLTPAGQFLPGQYILITGSVLNDGVYRLKSTGVPGAYKIDDTIDETFDGVIHGLRIPKDFIKLADEITAFAEKNPETNIVSETFGEYSYSMGTRTGSTAVPSGWREVFAGRLNKYRRMFDPLEGEGGL